MKEVVRVETYEQNEYVYSNIKFNTFNEWRGHKRFIIINNGNVGGYLLLESNVIDDGYKIISFEEFKSRYEPQLKIGDTFEHNGFVCEVKKKIEEKIWFILKNKYTKSITYRYASKREFDVFVEDNDTECNRITDQEFINQLEKHSIS